jgi:primosomal protein N' (replication factor Y) (superfamily II helicase)
MTYADIVLNRPTLRYPPAGSPPERGDASRLASYTYRLPERLRDAAQVGHLVQVPLRQGSALGVIVGLVHAPPPSLSPDAIRDVIDILDPLPIVTPTQIDLARWIANEYLASLSQAMRLMLPPDLEARTLLRIVPEAAAGPLAGDPSTAALAPDEAAVLRLLKRHRGRLSLESLAAQLAQNRDGAASDAEAAVQALAERGLLQAHYTLVPPRPAPPRVQYVRLLADDDTIAAALPRLGHSSRPADVLLTLARHTGAPLLLAELCSLAGCAEGPVQALAKRGWVQITAPRRLVVPLPAAEQPELGLTQRQAGTLADLVAYGEPVERALVLGKMGMSPSILRELELKGLLRQIEEPRAVLLVLPPGQVIDRVVELRGAEKQRAVLDLLHGTTGRVWVGGIYAQTGAGLPVLRDLADHGLISLHAEEYDRPVAAGQEAAPELTPDQEAVWTGLQIAEGGAPVTLLHGVTGSGKTEIYLRAIEATLAAGRRAIALVPEISLTAQTVRRFEARFPGRVAVLHSQLSLGQRYDVWDRVRHGEADVLIGPRSALLAPMSRLGLIVVDEAHDGSYKQGEPIPLPAYHACDVALALGQLTAAPVILGTATPGVVTYYRAVQGAYRLLELPRRILGYAPGGGPPANAPLPPVRIVDLRHELQAGNRGIFSRPLQQALRQSLEAGEQAILFLNRRGSSTFVLCRDCGYIARCPRCDTPLTFHRGLAPRVQDHPSLVCHHCNHREPPPSTCPNCGGRQIRYFGLGTERVEAEVGRLCPQARLLRWDQDTAAGPDHERFLQAFIDHRADVLIGTQMIAKGLDLPLVTLVGVISADTGLYLPDFSAAERTFQLLTQVAGRAGRSPRGGQVIVQTYNPDHYAVQAAAGHDYAAFYRQELDYRRRLGYPPFSRLVALRFSDQDPTHCEAEARHLGRWLAAEIRRLDLPASLIGPAPCFFSRVQGRYRWQIVIRAPDPMPLLCDVALPRGWHIDVDPINLL